MTEQQEGLWNRELEYFFSGCKNAATISDVITCMAAGNVLQVSRLPSDIVPAVVLLSTIGLRTYEQQIVDDYVQLLVMMDELFRSEWHDKYWHPNLNLVSFICIGGPRGEYNLDANPEAGYMFRVYERLINADIERVCPKAK